MSLRLVRSTSNATLWSACAIRFLDEIGEGGGPGGWPARLWVAHRAQRDALYALAAERGLAGWLAPPISFFSELPRLFGIGRRPIGLLTGRLLVARLAARESRRHGLQTADSGPARAHMLDAAFSELLPEGVSPRELREALEAVEGDDFSRRRNRWVADTYEAFLDELEARDRYDPRSIHAMVAARIEAGHLRRALGGARRLHIYGITSLRGRGLLFRALAADAEVEVVVYLPVEDGVSEWEGALDVAEVEVLSEAGADGDGPATDRSAVAEGRGEVRPAPDALREARWVAGRVKQLLAGGEARSHEVAVVARSGRHDTRLVHRALQAAGVPATARLRTPLAEVPALKATLALFRAQARGWPYRPLRGVLASPYFGADVDLRIVDWVARNRRVEGLGAWGNALARVRDATAEEPRRLWGAGVYPDRAEKAVAAFESFREAVAWLAEERREAEWLTLTLELLGGRWLDLRRRLCRPAGGDRWDVVRLDQRAVVRLEELLREWQGLLAEGLRVDDEPLDAAAWGDRLRRLLEANELALSTPMRTGVQVLEAHEAALTPFRQLFLVHANDGEFPRVSRAARVFTEEERRRLRAAGLPLTGREEALRRERTLWRAVTGAEQVVITYRTTGVGGAPRLPSLLVPEHDPGDELPRSLEMAGADSRSGGGSRPGDGRRPGDGAPDAEPVSPAEHRRLEVVRLAAHRRGGNGERPFATSEPARIRHAVLGAFAEELRCGGLDQAARSLAELGAGATEAGTGPPEVPPEGPPAADGPPSPGVRVDAAPAPADGAALFAVERRLSLRPHPWNGRLRDRVVLEELRRRFDRDYVWSASQLQTYGIRPFDFLLDRVLWIQEAEEAEEETSPLAAGGVVHAILERFYAETIDDLPEALEGETAATFERVAADVCGRAEADAERWLGLPAIWAVRRPEIVERVREFLCEELPRLARWGERPERLEYGFGGARGSPDDELERPPATLSGEDVRGRPGRLVYRGRIDRVDRKETGGRFRRKVIDYKSGGSCPQKSGYRDGATLQTALYMRAFEQLEGEEVHSGIFRTVKGLGWNRSELKRAGVDDVLRLALAIPPRVRAGLFEAVQAASHRIADWQPGRPVTRVELQLDSNQTRFDVVAGEPDAVPGEADAVAGGSGAGEEHAAGQADATGRADAAGKEPTSDA